MRTERALGLAGGAAGIEDRRVILGRQIDRRQRPVSERAPGFRPADNRFEPHFTRIAERILGAAGDINAFERRQAGQVRRNAGEAFIVAKQDLGSRISEAIFKFATCPPGVERRDDGADNAGGKEGHRPFGQVAHDDGDTIALRHAIGNQLCRQPERGAREIFKGDAFIIENEEDFVTMRAPGEKHIAQRRRGVFPSARRQATDDDGFHFERRARRG